MVMDRASIAAVVLAGGKSRRMGGGDKGLLMLADAPMLGHVLTRLRPQVARLAINANGAPDRFLAFGLPVITDIIEGFAGPLAGVHAGLHWASQLVPPARWIATVSSDVPFLPPDLVSRLAAVLAARPETGIAIARSHGREHPVIGLWPVALANALEAAIRSGEFRVGHWAHGHGAIVVDFPAVEIAGRAVDPFFNANTPEELDRARSILRGRSA